MSKNTILALLLLALLVPATLFAADSDETISQPPEPLMETSETMPEDDPNSVVIDTEQNDVNLRAIPAILDHNYRHQKKNQFEICPNGGAYLGNSIGQTWVAGVKTTYWINNTVGVGVNYNFLKLLTNRGSPFGSVLTDSNTHALSGQVVISQAAALRTGKRALEMDFYAIIGMGAMYLNRQWEPMGEIGGGVKFYTGLPWLAFRIDVDNYVHNTVQPGKNSIDFDVMMSGGVSFLFPNRQSAYDQLREKVED